ncbi:MAG: endopeptidase La [Ruminococcaceae bacterium]|nr:endopeptidase La [Oscillospiraceae bacterium]
MSIYIEKIKTASLPILALKDFVIYPYITANIEIDNKRDLKIIREASKGAKKMVIATLMSPVDTLSKEDVSTHATVVEIKKCVVEKKGKKNLCSVIVEGVSRAEIVNVTYVGAVPYSDVEIKEIEEDNPQRNEMAHRMLKKLVKTYNEFFAKAPSELMDLIDSIEDPNILCDYIGSYICFKTEDKLNLLAEYDLFERIIILQTVFSQERIHFNIEKEIHDKVQSKLVEVQKENYLREQMRVIQGELGEDDDDDLLIKLNEAKLPADISEKLHKEYSKLSKMSFTAPEATIIRNYIETCLELPWGIYTKDTLNIKKAKSILERDHYGLEKVKERILEFIATKKLANNLGGQILCLVGPPGVGKTSIAKSIAEALGRNYVRASLGGVRDEADIRGHRKTYLGSMPGRIINALKMSGSMNPLFLLDEVDKLTKDAHGDPSSALLEVLDSEQNTAFRDHFIELPVDLSQCIFIATANTLDTIPRPLLDRMEVIEVPSYTMTEKMQIAKKYLIPKQMSRHGLKKENLIISDSALKEVIEGYTKESGVRNLEREIAHLCRVVAKNMVTEKKNSYSINKGEVSEFLGNPKIKKPRQIKASRVGVVNGLAWTQVGGEMLEVEVSTFSGSGKIEITGSLGDVMKESARLAVSLCRANVKEFGIKDPDFYKNSDIHIHVPEGAVPKDGPSAGVTITTALISELTGIPVRSDVAMTGEITLRGNVLAIGGLREKTMAAYSNGIKTVIVPVDNIGDLEEVDENVKGNVNIIGASRINDVLNIALDR